MSATTIIPPHPPKWYGCWNHARFAELCARHDITTGKQLADVINARRGSLGLPGTVTARVALRWLTGKHDPMRAAAGREPMAVELALVFGVDLNWLTTGAP